ncbi:hypothetical protein SUGI_0763510 [Cryptomeria japonica]|nr:hypothetical protein SUGI_0763510 [Cryptomeria japonica]
MAGLEEEWSTLVSDIHFKRYGDALQKLQTIMFSRDAGSMLTARLRVSELLRKTAFSYLKLMAQKSIQDKLNMLQFLLDAFTCTHDREGFDKALLYLDSLNNANQMAEELCKCREKADAIREIRDLAQNMLSADSVQAEATRYIKQRRTSRPHVEPMSVKHSASYSYGIGIKKRNLQKLQEYRNIEVDDEKNISTHCV